MLRKLFVLFWNWVAYLMHTFLLGFYVKINLSDKFYLLRNALSTVVSGCCEAISLLWVNLFKSYFFHTFSFLWCFALKYLFKPVNHHLSGSTHSLTCNWENGQFWIQLPSTSSRWSISRCSSSYKTCLAAWQGLWSQREWTFPPPGCNLHWTSLLVSDSNNDKCCLTCIGGTDHLNWRLIQGFTLVLWDSNLPTFPCSSEARAELSWKWILSFYQKKTFSFESLQPKPKKRRVF